MGDTISSLVFRPPKPTPIHPSEYFMLDVDVRSPLCTNKRPSEGESCGPTMCLDTGESDLASLDSSFVASPNNQQNHPIISQGSTVPNIRNGQMYKIPAFFISRRNATQTILFSHGNAEDLGMMYQRMKDLAMVLGVNIMAYDYTGYGLSIPGPAHGNGSGSSSSEENEGPSENMIYRNIEAAYRYLIEKRNVSPHQIILYGRSLGSGPSCYLAAKTALNGQSVGGLILHSPFLSVYKVVADLNGLDMGLVGDMFNNEKRVRNIRCPTLIIHGKNDEVVPFWHSHRLLAAIPPEFRAAPFYLDNMGHNHIESRCRDQYVKVILNFLRMGVWSSHRAMMMSNEHQQQHEPNEPRGREELAARSSPANIHSYHGPGPIPLHERASPSEMKENASFYVNKTWLRHAKVLLKEVFVDAGCYANTTSNGSADSRWGQRRTNTSVISHNTGGVVDRYSKGLSDARDDEDEFSPWRSPTANNNKLRSSVSSKFVTGRPNNINSNSNAVGRPAAYYKKAQSMPATSSAYSSSNGSSSFLKSPPNANNKLTSSQQPPQNRASGYSKSKSVSILCLSRQRRT